jgi:hypothetical protein
MNPIFKWFGRRFKKWYQPDEGMAIQLKALTTVEPNKSSCEEVFAVLDQFAEAVHRGENVLIFMPLVRQHLDVCPGCREEYETLLKVLQPDQRM